MLRDNRKRAATARVFLLLLAAVSAAVVLLSLVGLASPSGMSYESEGLGPALTAASYGLLLILEFVLNLVGYLVIIRWLRRAYYNLHQLPGINPEYSDGWAAGAWFVPFLNFIRPFTIVREVWNDTQRAALGRVVQPATLLGWWWGTYLIRLVIGRLVFSLTSSGDTITSGDMQLLLADAAITCIYAVFTRYIIGRAAGFEEELALRQQVEQLGQLAPEVPVYLAVEQANYGQSEGY